jgi:hypothetical protein
MSMMSTSVNLTEYRNFWIVAENEASQVFPHAELDSAIAEYQFRLTQEDTPRFLGEKADNSLHDLTEFVTVSPSQES